MATNFKAYMETPTASIEITNTSPTDVTNYATAQVVDANLVSANIAKGVVVLGITGTHEGGSSPTGSITVTPKTTSQVIDVSSVATANINSIYEEISSTLTMDTKLLDDGNIGKMYKFTGTTTDTYDTDFLYVLRPKNLFNIGTTLTNCTSSSSNPTTMYEDDTATFVFTANNDCVLPDSISIIGATLVSYTKATGTVIISNPISNVTITINAGILLQLI